MSVFLLMILNLNSSAAVTNFPQETNKIYFYSSTLLNLLCKDVCKCRGSPVDGSVAHFVSIIHEIDCYIYKKMYDVQKNKTLKFDQIYSPCTCAFVLIFEFIW